MKTLRKIAGRIASFAKRLDLISSSDRNDAVAISHAWESILLAIPLSLLVVVVVESFGPSFSTYADDPASLIGVPLWALFACHKLLWAPVVFQLNAALLFALKTPRRGAIPLFVPGLLMSGAVAGYCYAVLVEYETFLGYPPFIAAYILVALFVFSWTQFFFPPDFVAKRRRLLISCRVLLPFFALVGMVVSFVANDRFYPGDYPTLHFSASLLSYLFAHLFISSVLFLLHPVRMMPAGVRLAAVMLFLNVFFLAVPLCGHFQSAKITFFVDSVLGQSYLYKVKSAEKEDSSNLALVNKDPNGPERFKKRSNYPALPTGFALDKYNIILISMESVRYDWSSFGDPKGDLTPNIRKFATDGNTWFTNAFTPCAITTQTFSSLFSMTYPSLSRYVLPEKRWLGHTAPEAVTVAELLRRAGYQTFWVGHGMPMRGLSQGFSVIRRHKQALKDAMTDSEIKDWAIQAIGESKARGKPFFGFVFFEAPHYPYITHYPGMPNEAGKDKYRQEVRYSDQQFGGLINGIRKSGLWDNSIIVFMGDHGEEFKDHRGGAHNKLYREVAQVVLAIHVPGMKGQRIDGVTSTLYLFPWLLQNGPPALAGAAEKVLTEDIGPMLRETDGAVVSELLWQGNMWAALTYPDYRLLYNFSSRNIELYDAKKDRAEKHNIFKKDSTRRSLFKKRLDGYLATRETFKRFSIVHVPETELPPELAKEPTPHESHGDDKKSGGVFDGH
ncbi:MAG: sulfatase-like hydrolase/transferase [Deltaproteobacteria bacterium]|nr:sulfatase-like hydrolase/transferase [Deltaproteobacteria bacterium]